MKVVNAVAEILKREGVEFLIGYPVNPIIEAAAEADIRTIIVRQERIGLHMCDAIAKVTSGDQIGVFAMQHGPGTENAFGGVAQSYGDSVPVVVLPAGYARHINHVPPNFNAALNFRHVTKSAEQVTVADATVGGAAPRLHAGQERPARPGARRVPDRSFARGDPDALRRIQADAAPQERPRPAIGVEVAEALVAARAAGDLRRAGRPLREGVAAVAGTGRTARSAGHDDHAGQERLPGEPPAVAGLRAASASASISGTCLQNADLVFGIGCCFTRSSFGTRDAEGQEDRPCDARPERHQQGRAGRVRRGRRCRADARRADRRGQGPARGQAARPARRGDPRDRAAEREEWLAQWMPR